MSEPWPWLLSAGAIWSVLMSSSSSGTAVPEVEMKAYMIQSLP
jgi:hypothetical protein